MQRGSIKLAAALSEPQTPAPVSYTHLDVYKRQAQSNSADSAYFYPAAVLLRSGVRRLFGRADSRFSGGFGHGADVHLPFPQNSSRSTAELCRSQSGGESIAILFKRCRGAAFLMLS